MIEPATWNALAGFSGKAWRSVGPLAGVVVGAWLATRTERKHWLLDNKKQEYRELLGTLLHCSDEMLEAHAALVAYDAQDQRRHAQAEKDAFGVIRDRIFISREVEEMKLEERWRIATMKLHNGHREEFASFVGTVRREIQNYAQRMLDKKATRRSLPQFFRRRDG